MDKDYMFFRNNLKRTILSQSRYLCPRKRPQPSKQLYVTQSVPILPSIPKKHFPKSSSCSDDEFKSATSITTEISSKTGLARKVLKVTIPTAARPWSAYSEDSAARSVKSWSLLSPVYVSQPAPSRSSCSSSPWRSLPSRDSHVTSTASSSSSSARVPEESIKSDDCLTDVISGVCLLDSLEQMKRRAQVRPQVRGVKSVLHRQIG